MVSWRFFWEKAWITARPRASEVMKSGSPVSASICAEGVGGAPAGFGTAGGFAGDCDWGGGGGVGAGGGVGGFRAFGGFMNSGARHRSSPGRWPGNGAGYTNWAIGARYFDNRP